MLLALGADDQTGPELLTLLRARDEAIPRPDVAVWHSLA